jgi:hypothetical protein
MPSRRSQWTASPLRRSIDHEAAAGLGAAGLELLAELEVGEGAAAAELGEADDGVVADDAEAAGVAGEEGDALEAPEARSIEAELAAAGLEQPQAVAVQAR